MRLPEPWIGGGPALFALAVATVTLTGTPARAQTQPVGLNVSIERLRNDRGLLRICVTRERKHFPDCSKDPGALRRSVPASTVAVSFEGLKSGLYAISILHDENGNGRMDFILGVPREGFGFSGNAAPRFGPPGFEAAAIRVVAGVAAQTVRMRYLL